MITTQLQFFVVGAQKCGTTALDHFLRLNRNLQMPRKKELHFFDNDELDWSSPDYSFLESEFDSPVPGRARGETTPMYLYWPPCIERIRAYNPAARIIVGLRHPTFRAFSQWKMATRWGNETLPFSAAIGEEGRRRYVKRSLYAEQIVRLLGHFPREQVFFFKADDLWHDSRSVIGSIEDFLGVPRANLAEQKYIAPRSRPAPRQVLEGETRRQLDGLFAPTILQTEQLTGLDLSDWKMPDYQESMVPTEGGKMSWIGRLRRRA